MLLPAYPCGLTSQGKRVVLATAAHAIFRHMSYSSLSRNVSTNRLRYLRTISTYISALIKRYLRNALCCFVHYIERFKSACLCVVAHRWTNARASYLAAGATSNISLLRAYSSNIVRRLNVTFVPRVFMNWHSRFQSFV